MENRFGFKDLLTTVLLLAVLTSVWLGMKQYDRMHDTLRSIDEGLKEQTRAQARGERAMGELLGLLEDGIVVTGGSGASDEGFIPTAELPDPFRAVREAQGQPDYATGDWVIDAFSANVAKITPMISRDYYASVVQSYVLESLAGRDEETLEWAPVLARTWSTRDNMEAWQAYVDQRMAEPLTQIEVQQEAGFASLETEEEQAAYVQRRLAEGRRLVDISREDACPHAVEYTFRLRRGLAFSDGEPLTAHDVVFTYNLIMNPDFQAPVWREQLGMKMKSVQAPDDYTVVFRFRQPYFDSFDDAAGLPVLPEHFYSQFTIEEINTSTGLLMGSGPYKVGVGPEAWAPGELLSLVRNDRYWEPDGQGAFDRVIFREINNDVARLAAFRNGEIDLFSHAIPEQYLQYLSDEELVQRSQSIEAFRVNDGYGWIAWNQLKNGQPTRFADQRVRQAMTLLIDRQRIIDEHLSGYGMVPSGPFNKISSQYNQSIEPWPYDPELAAELLAQAGYIDRDGDGIIESESGEPFIFTYTFPSSTTYWQNIGLMVKDGMAQAGIVVELNPLEWSVFGEKVRSADFDAISMAWTAGIESDIHHAFHSSNIGNNNNNFPAYANPELDALIDQARVTLDVDARMALWQRCHEILHEDQPYTFLYVRKYIVLADGRYKNLQENTFGVNSRLTWFTPTADQKY